MNAIVKPPHVFAAICGVMEDLAKEGISKDRRNSQQGYNFRGIDDVYNALAPFLAKHKLVITPRCLERSCVERQTQKGGALFYVTVDMEFVLTSAEDGSTITARTFGEAMDSADKATNKAQSAAFKYMAMQQFCIPTEGDNDADATTHEVAAKADAPAKPQGRLTAAEAKRQGLFQPMIDRIDGCDTITALDALYSDFDALTAEHPLSWLEPYKDRMEARREAIIQRDVGRPDYEAEFRDVVGPGPSSVAGREREVA